jgi:hypothetical protein
VLMLNLTSESVLSVTLKMTGLDVILSLFSLLVIS